MRILFDSKDKKYKSKFGTLRENEGCTVNIYVPSDISPKKVFLVFNRENGELYSLYSMKMTEKVDGYDVFSVSFSLAESGLYFYFFRIKTENEEFSLFKQGYDMTNMEEGTMWQLSCIPESFKVPDFYKGNIMYQIFPDRFYKSGTVDTAEKLTPFTIHDNLNDTPCYLPDSDGIVQNNDFFGGNIKGITEKLDYLKSLNVGVIYLNPIFKAYSNHRYDTADYLKIDELLGTEEDFISMCDEAHKRGMKIILDGVFSHTGSNSVYFDSEKLFGNGAVSNENSPYKEWFDFKNYPTEYTSWWGIKTLPCVDENNPSYRDYIIESENSVVAHWIKLGADGFRLDVADELPDSFIYALRSRLKDIKDDSLLIGEVWEDASNKSSYGFRRAYFTDGELDSVMNYPFRNAIIDLVSGNDTGGGFRETVMSIAENYPSDVLNSLMNILSTHDTVRILTCLGVRDVPSDKGGRAEYRMDEGQLVLATEKLFCAAFIQFMLPGMPCIYYGDEIGTEGFEDPFCRSFFDWTRTENNSILEFYKELSKMKIESRVLRFGDVKIDVLKEGVVKITRSFEQRSAYAIINLNDEWCENLSKHNILWCCGCNVNADCVFVKKYGFILFE